MGKNKVVPESPKKKLRKPSLEQALNIVSKLDIVPLLGLVSQIDQLHKKLLVEYNKEEPDYINVINPTYSAINKLATVDLLKVVDFPKPNK